MTAIEWFFSFLKKYRPKLGNRLFFVTVSALCYHCRTKISKIIVDDVIRGGQYELLWNLL